MHLHDHAGRDSPLSALDARVKIAATLAVLGMVLSSTHLLFPLVAATVALAVCIGFGVPLRSLLLRYAEPLFVVAVLIALKALFGSGEPVAAFSVGSWHLTVHAEGLREGLLIGSRILGAVGVIAVLGYSTPFNELLAALAWFRVPRGIVEVLLLAYRYIFLLFDEASTIYHAQKNRLGYASIGGGLRSFGVLAGSLTLKAFEHSQNTSLAMAQRGYDGTLPVGKCRPFRLAEIVLSTAVVMVIGVLWKLQ